jgi:hypothetical protein
MNITKESFFSPADFPDDHEPEDLYAVAPRRST